MERVISSPITPVDDQDHRQNYIAEAVNAEKQLWKLIHIKGIICTEVQELYRKARSSYEKIILSDHELAELQDIEYSLWKLHYKNIDEYRNRIRESSSNKKCTNLETMQNITNEQYKSDKLLEGFQSFLSESMQFYQDLIVKVRRSYGMAGEVMFFNDSSFSSSMDSEKVRRCQFSCHRYLVCLGDLARYKELYCNHDSQNRNWSVAATHYINASMIQPDSGNPQNQLALLAIYIGDEFLALYHCVRSLAAKEPFPDAWDNLILLFEKNRSCHLYSLSNEASFNFSKPYERSTALINAQSNNNFSHCHIRKAGDDVFPEQSCLWSLMVRMISFFYVKSSLKDFPSIFGSVIRALESFLSLDDARLKAGLEAYQHQGVARKGPFRLLQMVSVLIFTIHMLTENPKLENLTHMHVQKPSLARQALASTFICMGRLVNRCVISNPLYSSPLLPAILVFVEWLVDMLSESEIYATDEESTAPIAYFFNAFVDLLNQFNIKGDEAESQEFHALWEDTELLGFSPISKFQAALAFQTAGEPKIGFDNKCQFRVCRILVAAMKIANRSTASQKWIFFEKTRRKFSTVESKKLIDRTEFKEFEDNKSDVHRIFSPIEEEEVILFKPITRYNSAPLYIPETTTNQVTTGGMEKLGEPSSECFRRVSSLKLPKNMTAIDPSTLCSNVTNSSCTNTFWPDTILEDSVMDSFTEYSTDSRFGVGDKVTDGRPSPSGPPSLSAWVLNRENSGTIGGKGSIGSTKYITRDMEDIASAYVTGVSIGGTAVSLQDVNVASSAPSSHFICGLPSSRNPVIGHPYSSAPTHYMAPHFPPLPSAPLLPDDATWFSDSFNDTEHANLESMEEGFLGTSQVSSYSAGTKHAAKFEPSTAMFNYGYGLFHDRTCATDRSYQYQENLGVDRVAEHVSPLHFDKTTTLRSFHDHNVSMFTLCEPVARPLASHQMKHLEDMSCRPGFFDANGVNEQKNERLFHGYQKSRPHIYDAAADLRSEQVLLLQYLKEKEWHLQREAQLRGST